VALALFNCGCGRGKKPPARGSVAQKESRYFRLDLGGQASPAASLARLHPAGERVDGDARVN